MRIIATIRIEKRSNYSVLANGPLDDPRLSLKALGLLCYMLRQPDDWDYTVEWLASKHKDGRDSVRSCLVELEAAGYVTRVQTHARNGTFAQNDYIVREVPQDPPLTGFPSTVNPSADRPSTEDPLTENPTQSSTNNPSTTESNPPIVPPPKRKRRTKREAKAQPDHRPERFARFWAAYPRHESKQDAIAAWDKLKPDDGMLAVMAKALKRQLRSPEWQRGVGIPYAATWLNKQRWTDEPYIPPPAPAAEPERGGGDLWT